MQTVYPIMAISELGVGVGRARARARDSMCHINGVGGDSPFQLTGLLQLIFKVHNKNHMRKKDVVALL